MPQMRIVKFWSALLLLAVSVLAQNPKEVRQEVVSLQTQDGARVRGVYHYLPGTKPKVGIIIMHPRNDMTTHFILKPLALDGMGALGLASRNVGHSGIHEEMLLDLASGVKFLKSRGVETVLLAGHSGGGSLIALYEAQAETAPPNRIKHTPAGDPPDLNQYDLPKVNGLITMNAAEGEGLQIANHLDPSVTDENDPFSYDPSLDMYSPANGFRVPPEMSHYTPEFLERFRKAQHERAQRLVEIAMGKVREQNYYAELMKTAAYKQMSLADQLMIERRSQFEAPMIIYRARADPRYFDLTLDPNDRVFGHYFAGFKKDGFNRSDLQNWSREERTDSMTVRAFLSTESIASNGRLYENLGKLTVPVLVINASADPGIHPSVAKKTFESVVSKDKEKVWIIGGNHGFEPEGPKAGKGDQKEQAVQAIAAWAKKRWPW